jgi:hypothetical protein
MPLQDTVSHGLAHDCIGITQHCAPRKKITMSMQSH